MIMLVDGLDTNLATGLTIRIIEQATCVECCKYYIDPETASCGHTFCHGCWSERKTCPSCTIPLDRQKLKSNTMVQMLTNNIHELVNAHEKLFNISLCNYQYEVPVNNQSGESTKHVQEWLANSQNQFSAPTHLSQDSTQGLLPSMETLVSNVQIHTESKKTISPPKIICTAQKQDDWNKIEILPDNEDNCKNRENVVGPMDIEPFYLEENEYNTEHPHRSLRSNNPNLEPKLVTSNSTGGRKSPKYTSSEIEKKSLKTKQASNFKKMRKEFSKLNKQNRSKLNVSIEMFKKAENKKGKDTIPGKKEFSCLNTDYENHKVSTEKDRYINIKDANEELLIEDVNKDVNNKVLLTQNDNNSTNDEQIYDSTKRAQKLQTDMAISSLPRIEAEGLSNEQACIKPMPFLKKGSLCPKRVEQSFQDLIQNNVESTKVANDAEDIEISIKIGTTITNIVIKKKNSNLQVKQNIDKEVQTALGLHTLHDEQNTSKPEVDIHNIELNIDGENRVSVTKSTFTKKNTASVDTALAQFEITENIETELSDIMENVESKSNNGHKPESSSAQVCIKDFQVKKITQNMSNIQTEDIECQNDVDIFASGSVKESNVHLLKNAKKIPSTVLVPTIKTKSQNHVSKRERDTENETPCNKKQKVDNSRASFGKLVTPNTVLQDEPKDGADDSEQMTYDALIGQVFSNIDADIHSSNKKTTQTVNQNTLTSHDLVNQVPCSQIISKTPVSACNIHHDGNKEIINEKYSENIFSIIEKCDESQDHNKSNNQPPKIESMQQNIDKLLTPGMCKDLASKALSQSEKAMEMEIIEEVIGTPLMDQYDSDKSVVEETPQKNISFVKPKSKNDSIKTVIGGEEQLQKTHINTEKVTETVSQTIRSIINISDTDEFNKIKDATVIEIMQKKPSMETPLTINKFVNHIKHNSTPVARKSLNFESENIEDPEQTLCATTTQEKEFLLKAFEQTPNSSASKSLRLRNSSNKENKIYCLAGSCLTATELMGVKLLCRNKGWRYVDKFTEDLTHLVVGVDDENKSQRSVKYMCALAASKWIISYAWVEKCLDTKTIVDEYPYEALDAYGDPGPRRSRIAQKKLFNGITFYCMPPFSVLDVTTLKQMLTVAGGHVENSAEGVKVSPNKKNTPAFLLAEPENTQEDKFIYLAMELCVVPVNYEWVLNCLGSYSLCSIQDLLLCPSSLLPAATAQWPPQLMLREGDD